MNTFMHIVVQQIAHSSTLHPENNYIFVEFNFLSTLMQAKPDVKLIYNLHYHVNKIVFISYSNVS